MNYSKSVTAILQVKCGEDTIVSSCRESLWTNLSEYSCPKSNTSTRSLSLVLDTTTNMGEEIAQVCSARAAGYFE